MLSFLMCYIIVNIVSIMVGFFEIIIVVFFVVFILVYGFFEFIVLSILKKLMRVKRQMKMMMFFLFVRIGVKFIGVQVRRVIVVVKVRIGVVLNMQFVVFGIIVFLLVNLRKLQIGWSIGGLIFFCILVINFLFIFFQMSDVSEMKVQRLSRFVIG